MTATKADIAEIVMYLSPVCSSLHAIIVDRGTIDAGLGSAGRRTDRAS